MRELGTTALRTERSMRPSLLNPLFAPLTTLPGVGPKLEIVYGRLLGRAGMPRLIDLLFHLPGSVIDRRARPALIDAVPDTIVTVGIVVDRHRPSPPGRPRVPYRIHSHDDTGQLTLTYFNARPDYLQRLFPVGERRYVSGRVQLFDGVLQMVHPDRVVDERGFAELPLFDPVYPLTEGLGAGQMRRAIEAALGTLPSLPEWQDPTLLARHRWPAFA